MSSATILRDHAGVREDDAVGIGPILVATDGTASAEPALRAAAQFASHSASNVVVISVIEPVPLVGADYGLLLPPIDSEESRRSAVSQRVQEQMAQITGAAAGWKIELREGDPATELARAARDIGPRMIVMGLGHHELLDRLFGGETALHTLRASARPVFAVAPAYNHLPRRAVVATDFSAASIRAARTGLAIFDTLSMVYLVHVAPRLEMQPESFAAWIALYGEGVVPAFERVKAELGLPEHVRVETITLQGKPSREILAFAKSSRADVVITGSHGAGLIDRLLVGSTATGLIRGAQCSVLAVPTPRGLERQIDHSDHALTEEDWAAELEAFTRRNAGRRATLEVDDPELGAQAQEHDYPFLGAAYDHNDRRVEIMVGDFVGVSRHLTRGIADVHAIGVLRDEHGRDWILRIGHGDGQTILTLVK